MVTTPLWNEYFFDRIVAFDCEHVHLQGSARIEAATVSVDYCEKELYSVRVKHRPGLFLCNDFTFEINGFKANSFWEGFPFGRSSGNGQKNK